MNITNRAVSPVKLSSLVDNPPHIIAVIDDYKTVAELWEIFNNGATAVEIRFDLLGGSFDEKIAFVQMIRNSAPFLILGTLRETENNVYERNDMVEEIIKHVDAIDEEVSYPSAAENLRKAGRKIKIASHHDYKSTPATEVIAEWAKKCKDTGADIVKLAFHATTEDDVQRIRNFGVHGGYGSLIIVAMGYLGVESRRNPLSFGSVATYAFTGKSSVAPGQLSVAEISSCMKKR